MSTYQLKDGWEQRLDAVILDTGFDELIADWLACKFKLKETTTLRQQVAELEAENEKMTMQLAGCSTATYQNTHASKADRIDSSNPYYSAAYSDICDAVDREIAQRERAEKAESQLSAYREALEAYANPNSWSRPLHINGYLQDKRALFRMGEDDGHKIARQALAGDTK
jgi:ribosomal protein S20